MMATRPTSSTERADALDTSLSVEDGREGRRHDDDEVVIWEDR